MPDLLTDQLEYKMVSLITNISYKLCYNAINNVSTGILLANGVVVTRENAHTSGVGDIFDRSVLGQCTECPRKYLPYIT